MMKFLVLALLCAIYLWDSVSGQSGGPSRPANTELEINYKLDCKDLNRACFIPNNFNIELCFQPPSRVPVSLRVTNGHTAQMVSSRIESVINTHFSDSKSSITSAIVRIYYMPQGLSSKIRLLNDVYAGAVIYQYYTERKEIPHSMVDLYFPHDGSMVVFSIGKDGTVSEGIHIKKDEQWALYGRAHEYAKQELASSGNADYDRKKLKESIKGLSPGGEKTQIAYHGTAPRPLQGDSIRTQNGKIESISDFLMGNLDSLADKFIPVILIESFPSFNRYIQPVGIGSQVCEPEVEPVLDDPKFEITLAIYPPITCTVSLQPILDDGLSPFRTLLKFKAAKCVPTKLKYVLNPKKSKEDIKDQTVVNE